MKEYTLHRTTPSSIYILLGLRVTIVLYRNRGFKFSYKKASFSIKVLCFDFKLAILNTDHADWPNLWLVKEKRFFSRELSPILFFNFMFFTMLPALKLVCYFSSLKFTNSITLTMCKDYLHLFYH